MILTGPRFASGRMLAAAPGNDLLLGAGMAPGG
jgi:hypothetical protein